MSFNLEVAKACDDKTICTVFGFIRNIERTLLSNNVFYIVPALVKYICVWYYRLYDKWDKIYHGNGIKIVDNCIIKKSVGNDVAFLETIVYSGYHIWKFEIKHIVQKSNEIIIGIWNTKSTQNISDIINKFFTHDGRPDSYAFCMPNAEIINHETGHSDKSYAVKCKSNDIIEMHLNMDQLHVAKIYD